MPKVSVVIPTLNRCEKLRQCLTSLTCQSFKDFDVIVVDGGSTDGTLGMLQEFQVQVIRQKGIGIANAENLGIHNSKGEIIAFLDDDCIADPSWLSNLVNPYVASNRVGGTGGTVRIGFTPVTDPTKLSLFRHLGAIYSKIVLEGCPSRIGVISQSGALTQNFDKGRHLLEVDHIQGCNMSFLSRVLKTLGGLDEGYSGTGFRWETDLCIRVRRSGYKIMFNPEAEVFHNTDYKKFLTSKYKYYEGRNDIYFFLKNLKPSNAGGWFRFLIWQLVHTGYSLYWYFKSHNPAYLQGLLGKIHGFQFAVKRHIYP
jgi:GT2 family glycosyltransferase